MAPKSLGISPEGVGGSMATDLILPNPDAAVPRPPDSGAVTLASVAADQYADFLLDLVTPCAEEGGAESASLLAAPAFQECTSCNGLDANFLDQFTDLDQILNMDMSQQHALTCLDLSPDLQDGDVFLLEATPSSSTPSPGNSDLDTPTGLYIPTDAPATYHSTDQAIMALLCENTDAIITPTTPSVTSPTTTPSITSSTSPLSILYNALSPHKRLLSGEDDLGVPSPSLAKRPHNAPSGGLGKRGTKYAERRQKNNEASKVSRKRRKERHQELVEREEILREENAKLRRQVEELMNETSLLKSLLVTRLAGQRTTC